MSDAAVLAGRRVRAAGRWRPTAASGRSFGGFVALAAAVLVGLFFAVGIPAIQDRPVNTEDLLIGLLGVLTLVPTCLALLRKEGDLLEPLPVIGGLFFIYFVARAAYLADGTPDFRQIAPNIADDFPRWIAPALRLTLACVAAAFAGYLLPFGKLVAQRLPRVRRFGYETRTSGIVLLWFIGLGVQGLAIARGAYLAFANAQNLDLSTQSYVELFGRLDLVAVFLLSAKYYQGKLSPRMRLFLFLCVLPEGILMGFVSGSKIKMLLPVAFFLAARHYFKKKLGLREITILVLVVAFVAIPLGSSMRAAYTTTTNSTTGRVNAEATVDVAQEAVESVQHRASKSTLGFMTDSLLLATNRLCGLDSSMVALKMTPSVLPWTSTMPYYMMPLIVLIPRVIWKAKPIPRAVPNWESDYWGLASDNPSAISITHTAAFYLAFGWTGAVLGMLILGIFWRVLYDWHQLQGGAFALCSYFLLLKDITDIEGDPTLVYMGLTHTMLLALIVAFVAGERPKKTA